MNPEVKAFVTDALNRLIAAQTKTWMDVAPLLIGFATFVVLVRYTWETYKLRVAAQKQISETDKLLLEAQLQNQLSVKPMFAIHLELIDGQNRIAIENVGFGPAFNVYFGGSAWSERTVEIQQPENNTMKAGEIHWPQIYCSQASGQSRPFSSVADLFEHIYPHQRHDVPALDVILHCMSLSLKHYAYVFRFVRDSNLQIQVFYKGEKSNP
jgi:hypothetical protein